MVFPGATLTLEAGTVVEFSSQTDRHQFSRAFSPSLSCLSEIFVYGTLTSEGVSGNRVVFRGPSGSTKSDDWGGIHQLTGGEVTVGNHTDVLNGTPIEYEFPPGSGIFSKCPPTYPAPVLIGALDPEVEESLIPEGVPPSPVDVGVYTNTAPNSNQPVWSLIGADASTFSLVQTSSNSANERTLQFKEPPNYEVPLAGGGYKTTYDIGVVITDVPLSGAVRTNGAALADTLLVTVEVTNAEEAGSVVLSPLPPRVEVPLVARLTDPDEGLTFTGASWAWQRRADDTADWEPVSTGAVRATENYPELSSYRPPVSDVGYQLQATVSYTDNHGPNKSAESDPAAAVVGGLGLSGPDERDVPEVVLPETEPRVVATYEATAAEGVTVGWSLAGPDQDAFVVRDGVLTFASGPDYEAPTDAGHATDEDGNNVYHVTVQAMAGEQTATVEAEVEVTNADDPGVVELSSTQPEVDEPIRATLTDPDGSVEHVRWSWLYFSSEDSPRNGEPTVVSSSDEFIPSDVLMGLRLQAQALYADGHGTNHSAESVQTEPVVGRPSAPQNLTATPSDGALVLAWDAPSLAGYPAFSGYRYRYKTTAGTAWQPSATGALVEQTTRPTLEGLTHGKEYTVEVWAVNAQGAGPAATTTATPLSPDTPGRVELTSRRPRVGVPITATLVDPDAPVRVRRWQWLQSPWYYRSAGDSSLVAPSEERYPELASYEPTVPALGRRLRAVVDYTDQYGPQSAQSAWTAPVLPGRPEAPALSATAGDGQVALTWTAAADQGAAIVRYQYHRSDKPSGWLDVPGDGLDGHYTVGGLTNDADYTFKVRAVNSVGEGSPSNAVTATPQGPADPNPHAPAIAGPEEVSVAEGHTGALADADYTTSDDDGDAVTLTLTDAARGPFSLSSSGTLQVTSALDYESDDTRYEVTLTATDDGEPSKSSTKQVTVTVDNVDEVGTVTLSSSSPQVGDHLTATLSDPDGGIRNVSWSWQDIPRSDESDDAEPPRTTSYPYTVEASDEGRRIEVQARYTDAHGSGKTARATTEVVQEAAESNRYEPAIAGPEEVSVAEGHTGALADADYTTSDDDGDAVTLTLTDAARGPFSLSSSGTLHVTSALDYESDDTRYEVTLTATDDGEPSKSSTKQVTVTVTNQEEEGTVRLSSSQPQVGVPITARLSDPDGNVENVRWSWLYFSSEDGSRNGEPTVVASSDELIPSPVLVGLRLQARALYDDGQGPNQSAESVQTEPVQEAAESNRYEPAIAGPEEVSVAEGHTGALADADYTTSDDDGDAVTLTLTDAARGPFSLSSSGTLQASALDYERDDTRYEVTLTATDDGEPSSRRPSR